MTMNYSHTHRTYFPVNMPEENLVSSVKDWYVYDGGMAEKSGGGVYGMPQFVDWNWGNSFDFRYEYDQSEKGGSFESVASDVIDLLPSDPFGMGISATITAIAGWVEDFESDRVNLKWNRNSFHTEPVKMGVYGNTSECKSGAHQGESSVNCKGEKHLSFNNEDVHPATERYTESEKGTGICSDVAEGAPHDALLYVLGHLGLKDLLSVERVCKFLHSSVLCDTLLWRNISIHKPLCLMITDEDLLNLTNRAKGDLLCLSLEGCTRITDDGLKRVLDSNKRLTKLNVDGCIGLTVQGIVDKLKAFKSDTSGINHLRIGNRGITREQFVTIKCLIGEDKCMQLKADTAHYFRSGHSSPSCDDDRAIDVEECPKCANPRLVYDCPVESCKGDQSGIQICRACTLCIPRCGECGRCVHDTAYDETFFLEKVCAECRERPTLDHLKYYAGARESSTSGLV